MLLSLVHILSLEFIRKEVLVLARSFKSDPTMALAFPLSIDYVIVTVYHFIDAALLLSYAVENSCHSPAVFTEIILSTL